MREHGSGSSSNWVFIVEARTSCPTPQKHRGMLLGSEWQRVEFVNTVLPFGVPNGLFEPLAISHGFLDFNAATTLAHWWMTADDLFDSHPCIQTRLVKIQFKCSYETKEIGVGPTMNLTDIFRSTKFAERVVGGKTDEKPDAVPAGL